MAAPDFHASRCVRYRYRYSGCRRCAEACPHEAIALSDDGIRLDAVRCRDCQLCTAACRTGALSAGGFSRIDFLKAAIRHPEISVGCEPSGVDATIRAPCLGVLDGTLLAYLSKRGIAVDLLGTEHCDACEHGARGRELLATQLSVRDTLERACEGESWAPVRVAEAAPESDPSTYRPGRRHLLRRLLGRGVEEVARAAAPPADLPVADRAIRPGPWYTPEMRELLQIVGRRAENEPCPLPAHPALPLAEMRLAPGCTQCEACLRACPTGAIQVRETDRDWTMLFLPGRCVGCALCVEVCQPGVLRRADTVDAAPERQPIPLNLLAKQRCTRCDRFFVSPHPASTCPVCVDDDTAFARIFA